MQPRTALAIGVVTLLLTTGCVGTSAQQSAPTDAGTDHTTIDVTATAERTAPPDVALVRVAVVATAPDADSARSRVAANASGMRDALTSAGLDDDRIRTTYFDVGPVYETVRDRREIAGYRGVQGFEIRADADGAGSMIDTAAGSGANRVEGVSFTLSEDTRRAVRERALEGAMADAAADARVIAVAGNVSVTGLDSVSTTDSGFLASDVRFGAESDTSGTVIDPGPVTVSVTVSVSYRAA